MGKGKRHRTRERSGEAHRDPPTCGAVAREAWVERYLTGRLTEPEAAAFESHYLTCLRCQEELRLAAAVREELGGGERAGDRSPSRSSESEDFPTPSEEGERPEVA
jgi:hypothetical protein